MSKIKFKIATPERIVLEEEVSQATIPTTAGEITVLPNHIPLVSILAAGEMRLLTASGEEKIIAIAGGFLEIKGNNEIIILADNAEQAQEIDIKRAEEAKKRAQEQMEKIKNVEDVDYARLQAIIDRETNRMRVGKKYKNLPPTK